MITYNFSVISVKACWILRFSSSMNQWHAPWKFCCVDDTSPGWLVLNVDWLHISINHPQPGGTWTFTRFLQNDWAVGGSERRPNELVESFSVRQRSHVKQRGVLPRCWCCSQYYFNVLTFLFRQEQLVACKMPAPIPRVLRDASVSTGSRKKPV